MKKSDNGSYLTPNEYKNRIAKILDWEQGLDFFPNFN
jgi:hypothetical protein